MHLHGCLCCHGDLCSLTLSKQASSWGLSLEFIRDQNQCHGVTTYSGSQNEYHNVVHHVMNALELGLHLLSTQEAGLSDYLPIDISRLFPATFVWSVSM